MLAAIIGDERTMQSWRTWVATPRLVLEKILIELLQLVWLPRRYISVTKAGYIKHVPVTHSCIHSGRNWQTWWWPSDLCANCQDNPAPLDVHNSWELSTNQVADIRWDIESAEQTITNLKLTKKSHAEVVDQFVDATTYFATTLEGQIKRVRTLKSSLHGGPVWSLNLSNTLKLKSGQTRLAMTGVRRWCSFWLVKTVYALRFNIEGSGCWCQGCRCQGYEPESLNDASGILSVTPHPST